MTWAIWICCSKQDWSILMISSSWGMPALVTILEIWAITFPKYLQSDKPPSAPKKSSTPNLPSAALAFIIFVQDPVYPVFDQNSDVQGLGAADSYFGSPTLKLQTPSSSRLASSYANNALLYQSITTFAGTNFRSSTTTSKVPDSRGFGSSTGWVAGFNFDFQKSQLNRS